MMCCLIGYTTTICQISKVYDYCTVLQLNLGPSKNICCPDFLFKNFGQIWGIVSDIDNWLDVSNVKNETAVHENRFKLVNSYTIFLNNIQNKFVGHWTCSLVVISSGSVAGVCLEPAECLTLCNHFANGHIAWHWACHLQIRDISAFILLHSL